MNEEVKKYLNGLKKWKAELTKLRKIILECGLKEEFKWMHPCYTDNGKNIVLIHDFKEYCALLFHKGVLLKDSENLLVQQTENVQSARQIRFTDLPEIHELKPTIKEYIKEAIEIEKSGKKIEKKKTSDFNIPKELEQIFSENPNFKKAFKNLSAGRQRGYLLHFDKPKQSKTKLSRIAKNMERIIDGYGLNDCVCGLSKRKPNCDGSHKQLENCE
ncbi:Uncharacterized conserved protein YdeI, YjbR/CyaY-like superfamily, DUF1801 family [Bizionia echini]|uniref:Uncharacterized conserved protein YdeI, YjbR/CyaY-like superfamily, DUF1801 family n=1 Tax=Bizionia echini TaxID=649333 RepID=A0A1I5CH90_9FLAO|nr:DUF1801 domain-containing protein [Bizionia echini]SFN86399.1 Uncharacterized conserved protein YdeI, YjbR/CyaY-like superfamily, DUF1801 family [Bizionia echini]